MEAKYSNRYGRPIYVIGDSHASLYSGKDRIIPKWPEEPFVRGLLPFFQPIRLGPVLAYNLCEHGKPSLGRERLFLALACIPPSSRVLLCFGEIDCRAHILRHAERRKRPIGQVIEECIARYFGVVLEVQRKGFEVGVSSVAPSAPDGVASNPEYPHYGGSDERNAVTEQFNCLLEAQCADNAIFFLNVTRHLLDGNGRPLQEYFLDGVHLSQRSLMPAISLLREEFPDMDFHVPAIAKMRCACSAWIRRIRNL